MEYPDRWKYFDYVSNWLPHKVAANNSYSIRCSLAGMPWFKKDRQYGFSDCKTMVTT
jgi:hypothetical protein